LADLSLHLPTANNSELPEENRPPGRWSWPTGLSAGAGQSRCVDSLALDGLHRLATVGGLSASKRNTVHCRFVENGCRSMFRKSLRFICLRRDRCPRFNRFSTFGTTAAQHLMAVFVDGFSFAEQFDVGRG